MPGEGAEGKCDHGALPEVGFVGAGLMGHGICRSLLRGGFTVSVLANRRRDRVDDLVAHGASEASMPRELVGSVDVLMLCLPGPADVREILDGADGILGHARAGLTIFDCTTSDAELTVELAAKAAALGIDFIDLPLMKGPQQALDGELNLIVGAAEDAVARFRALFDAISARQFFAGAVGNAHRIKILNNSVSMCTMAAVCETFAAASAGGIDLRLLLDVMSSGNANSPTLQRTAPRLIAGDYEPMATVATCAKDVALFVDMEERLLGHAFMGPAARELFAAAAEAGYREADGSAAFEALRGQSEH